MQKEEEEEESSGSDMVFYEQKKKYAFGDALNSSSTIGIGNCSRITWELLF